MIELHHVRGFATVGPGLGEVVRVFKMERGVETGVGRCVFVFQVKFGQKGVRLFVEIGRRVFEVFAQRLVHLNPVEQQVIALLQLLIPQRLSDEQQSATGLGPVHQLINLTRGHVVALPEHQQAVLMRLQGRQEVEAIGVIDGQALLAQEVFCCQVRIGLSFGGRAVIDFYLIGHGLEVQISSQRSDQSEADRTDRQPPAPVQWAAPGPNKPRQASHSSCCACAGGRR
ncbi:hypothetical protein D3C84_411580 [compost metagenome]